LNVLLELDLLRFLCPPFLIQHFKGMPPSSIKSLCLVKIHHTLGIPLLEDTIQTCDSGILFLEKVFPEQPQLEHD